APALELLHCTRALKSPAEPSWKYRVADKRCGMHSNTRRLTRPEVWLGVLPEAPSTSSLGALPWPVAPPQALSSTAPRHRVARHGGGRGGWRFMRDLAGAGSRGRITLRPSPPPAAQIYRGFTSIRPSAAARRKAWRQLARPVPLVAFGAEQLRPPLRLADAAHVVLPLRPLRGRQLGGDGALVAGARLHLGAVELGPLRGEGVDLLLEVRGGTVELVPLRHDLARALAQRDQLAVAAVVGVEHRQALRVAGLDLGQRRQHQPLRRRGKLGALQLGVCG